MSIQALERRPVSYRAYMQNRSADVAIKRNGFLEAGVDPRFLWPHVLSIRDSMKFITDNAARQAHFPWYDLIRDIYGKKYTQEVGLKSTQPDDSENKFTFHFAPGMMKSLWENNVPVLEYALFFKALHELDQWSLDIALAVAEMYDKTNRRHDGGPKYPGSMVQKIKAGSRIIRVLRYRKKNDDAPDAKPHVDRSIFTVHAWSSHPGLKMFSSNGMCLPVNETAHDSVAIFPGEKYAAVTRGLFGFGTPHGVRDERHTNGTRDEDRYAIVCFVHPVSLKQDAEWLLANRERIEEHEAILTL